jgi:RHS repeat-associated protein
MVVYGSSSNPQTLTMFLYAPNGKVLSQLAYQKNGSNWAPIAINALTNYLYLGGKALSYAENNVGSNGSGTYWPYGSTNTNPTTGPSTFATYLGDFSGLDYADQRFYDYNWGRFQTADPSNANINPTNSGSWNRYAYVNGDPANGSDPHGRDLQICPASGENGGVCYTIPDASTENDVFNITTDSDGNVIVTNVTNVESVTVVGVADPQEYTFTYDLNGDPLDQNGNPDTALILNPTSVRLSWPLGSRTTYAGPGSGQGLPNGQSDAYAQTHDLCYQNAGVTALTTAINVLLFRTPSAAQQACDAQLCSQLMNAADNNLFEGGDDLFNGSQIYAMMCGAP